MRILDFFPHTNTTRGPRRFASSASTSRGASQDDVAMRVFHYVDETNRAVLSLRGAEVASEVVASR
ncbi:hypothetical protein NFJ02_11g04680 [Pycnococcus provasolii]